MEQENINSDLFHGLVRSVVENGVDYLMIPLEGIKLDSTKITSFEVDGLTINLGYLPQNNILVVYPENVKLFTEYIQTKVFEDVSDVSFEQYSKDILPGVFGADLVSLYKEILVNSVDENGVGYFSILGSADSELNIVNGRTVPQFLVGLDGVVELLKDVSVYDFEESKYTKFKGTKENIFTYLDNITEIGSGGSSLVVMFRLI